MSSPTSNTCMLERVHALARAAMESVVPAAPPAAAALSRQLTPLERAWLKSLGRVPGLLEPLGGWDRLAAAAGLRPAVRARETCSQGRTLAAVAPRNGRYAPGQVPGAVLRGSR